MKIIKAFITKLKIKHYNEISLENKVMEAFQENNVLEVKKCFEDGLNPNFGSNNIAIFAAMQGKLEMLKYLLSQKCNMKCDFDLKKILLEKKHYHIMEFLFKLNRNLN